MEPMNVYRLYIGHDIPEGGEHEPGTVLAAVMQELRANGIDGATITHSIGVWRGTAETCTVVEMILASTYYLDVQKMRENLRVQLAQDEVLHTVSAVAVA